MRLLPGAAGIIMFIIAAMLLAYPAAIAFSVDAGSGTSLTTAGKISRSIAVDESYNGYGLHVDKKEIVVVRLKETDPAQAWRFIGPGSFVIVSDTVLETYPMLHDFRVKVLGPGDLRFDKIDSRDNATLETFTVHIVIEEPASGGKKATSYPLYALTAIRPCLRTFSLQDNV